MKAYSGFKAQKASSGFPELPAGGYVCKIISARDEEGTYGEQLVIAYDVTEGEYKGFWKSAYDADTRNDKKWGGVCYIRVPDETDEAWMRRAFENFIYAVEESNPGYHWDWNEGGLKGRSVGIIVGEKEKLSKDGTQVFTNTVARGTASVDDIRNSDFKIPKKKELKNKPKASAAPTGFTEMDDSDDELPF
ncbi:MAG: hypothetical protein Q4F79_04435 [Eubacteriales bacterium]|nr:hypothetical protein [Eubacteriales bacterium]